MQKAHGMHTPMYPAFRDTTVLPFTAASLVCAICLTMCQLARDSVYQLVQESYISEPAEILYVRLSLWSGMAVSHLVCCIVFVKPLALPLRRAFVLWSGRLISLSPVALICWACVTFFKFNCQACGFLPFKVHLNSQQFSLHLAQRSTGQHSNFRSLENQVIEAYDSLSLDMMQPCCCIVTATQYLSTFDFECHISILIDLHFKYHFHCLQVLDHDGRKPDGQQETFAKERNQLGENKFVQPLPTLPQVPLPWHEKQWRLDLTMYALHETEKPQMNCIPTLACKTTWSELEALWLGAT